jgi:hypothetical protein
MEATEATVGAMEEIDTNIVDAKNTNDEDTGDNGVMDKQLKELKAEYQDEEDRKNIARKIAIKTPAPAPAAPRGAAAPPAAPRGAAPPPPAAPAPVAPPAPALGLEDMKSINPLKTGTDAAIAAKENTQAQGEALLKAQADKLKAELKAKTDAAFAAKENAEAKLKAGKEQLEAGLKDLTDPQKLLTKFFLKK